MTGLQVVWFLLVGVLFCGYAVLDGFDLGAGLWHLRLSDEKQRRMLLGSIGPFWDGNEVWLLTAGGALFAAFPEAYATVFSAFYLALTLAVLCLVFRAVALEFRHHVESVSWKRFWDFSFGVGSSLFALLLGVALGNVVRGLPLDGTHTYTGGFFDLLNPYSLAVGVYVLVTLWLHGAAWLAWRTEGELRERARAWMAKTWWLAAALFVLLSVWSVAAGVAGNFRSTPVLWLIPVASAVSLGLARAFSVKGRDRAAFFSSALSIVLQIGTAGASLFPNLVPALGEAGHSLTISEAASSQGTLTVMLVLAILGMPVVIGYTLWSYRKLGGMTEHAY